MTPDLVNILCLTERSFLMALVLTFYLQTLCKEQMKLRRSIFFVLFFTVYVVFLNTGAYTKLIPGYSSIVHNHYLEVFIGLYGGMALCEIIFFRMRWRNAVYYTIIYYFATNFIVATLNWISYSIFGIENLQEMYTDVSFRLLEGVFEPGIAACMVLLLVRLMKVDMSLDITFKELFSIIVLAIPFYICSAMYKEVPVASKTATQVFLETDLVSLSFAVAIIGLIQSTRLQSNRAEMNQMKLIMKNQYEQLIIKKEAAELILQKGHDFEKQLQFATVGNGTTDNWISEWRKTVRDYVTVYDTGNLTLNTILSDRARICSEKGIQLLCFLNGEDFSFMDTMDMVTIFCNALDNAIENAEKLEDNEKKEIRVKAKTDPLYLFLQFQNYYDGQLEWRGNELVTAKEDKSLHGYGLKSIRYCIGKYNGDMEVDAVNGKFLLKIRIPISGQGKGMGTT